MQEQIQDRQAWQQALVLVGVVTAMRLIVLFVSPLELYPDEAQYWSWAQAPALGYFSKPPMIAWIVWSETALLGDAEWAIRLASPVLHAFTALVVFAIGRRLFESRIALLGALAYLTTPGVSYSSTLMSTDVPLLLCWAVALYAFLRAREEESWRWPILCGAAIGTGLLSKYAMLYFLLGAAVACMVDAKSRRLVLGVRGLAIVAVAIVLFAPNIWWNAQHGFPTVAHTESNAAWGKAKYNPLTSLVFLLGQFGVFGPILMAGFVGALWRLLRNPASTTDGDRLLAAFSAPPLALMVLQSFIVTANANWAATTYVAASPLAVRELLRWWRARPLWASFALNGAALVLLALFVAVPPAAERLGVGNAFKREQGWRALGRQVAMAASRGPFDAIAAVNRSEIAELLYYARPRSIPVKAWTRDPHPRDQFQMTMRLTPGAQHVLLAVDPHEAKGVLATFDSGEPLERIVIPVGGRHQRITQLVDARHYRGP